jgi:uncharacterized protein (TIGR00725 family)
MSLTTSMERAFAARKHTERGKNPDCSRNAFTGAQIRIGVMGSAAELSDHAIRDQCRRLGRAIAEHGCCLLTGACPGIPHEVALGAKEIGGHTMGISPASGLREHIETFKSPYREYDVLVFTGLGLMGRELINIRSSDIIVVVGGRCGTLGEFAIGYEEGKLIGVLTGTGGIADLVPEIVACSGKETGSEVIYDAEPPELIGRLLERYQSSDYHCDCKPRSFVSQHQGKPCQCE